MTDACCSPTKVLLDRLLLLLPQGSGDLRPCSGPPTMTWLLLLPSFLFAASSQMKEKRDDNGMMQAME